MADFHFTPYTHRMYLNSSSRGWTYFNNLRLKKLNNLFRKYDGHFERILEIGSFDLYFATTILDYLQEKNCKGYTFADTYTSKELLAIAKSNLAQLKSMSKIDWKLICSTGETLSKKLKGSFSSAFIFETLEHVQDEQKVIKNLCGLLDTGGIVFVSVPQESGLMFFFKELGRRFVLGKTNHSPKELLYATFGKMDKVERVVGGHRGYDPKKTKAIFLKQGFELLEGYSYPNNTLSYGRIFVFKKMP